MGFFNLGIAPEKQDTKKKQAVVPPHANGITSSPVVGNMSGWILFV